MKRTLSVPGEVRIFSALTGISLLLLNGSLPAVLVTALIVGILEESNSCAKITSNA